MTSALDNSSVEIICPFSGEVIEVLSQQQALQQEEQRALVRERHVAVFSSNPLYQARADKDPAYWQTFSAGGIR